jgi:alkylhydroperoxidase/carboxymuconolactone decarboxylase family protein YurZ
MPQGTGLTPNRSRRRKNNVTLSCPVILQDKQQEGLDNQTKKLINLGTMVKTHVSALITFHQRSSIEIE